jgi:urea transporter
LIVATNTYLFISDLQVGITDEMRESIIESFEKTSFERNESDPPLFPLKTLPQVSKWTASRGGVLHLLDASLRGIGQVFFCNSPVSGAMFLLAVLVSDLKMAALLVLAVASATAFAKAMEFDSGLLAAGIWGYNSALLGCALSVFSWGSNYPPHTETLSTVFLLGLGVMGGACMTVIVTGAVARLLVPQGITPLTFPFQLVTWVWLLGAQQWGHVTARSSPLPKLQINMYTNLTAAVQGTAAVEYGAPTPFQLQVYDPVSILLAAFSGIAQTFLVPQWYCGLIMLLGIGLCSMISAAWALIGSLVGCIVAMGLGVNPQDIYFGLHGYNSCLVGMALGGFFLVQRGCKVNVVALMGIVAAEVVTTATSSAFSPVGLPALTWPFTVITWLMILATMGIPSITPVATPCLTTAEDHRKSAEIATIRITMTPSMEVVKEVRKVKSETI